MAQQFRLVLKSGSDNIRRFQEASAQGFKRGELVKLAGTGTTALLATMSGSLSTDILGVAAKDGQDTTTPAEMAEVYVVTPEQVWELHVDDGKIPRTNYSLGDAYKISQLTSANYTITREDETASATVAMRGPVLKTGTATARGGLVLVGYSSDATKAKKGQKVLVRFGVDALQASIGRTP